MFKGRTTTTLPLVWWLLFVTPSILLARGLEEEEDFTVTEEELDSSHSHQGNDEVFVPTKEWQTVKEGQHIPPGLHVRMDLQTGLKEAKLLDESTEESTGVSEMNTDTQGFKGDFGAILTGEEGQRTQLYGKSDRRGVINKRTKVFSAGEVASMLEDINDDTIDLSNLPQIASSGSPDTGFNYVASHEHPETRNPEKSKPSAHTKDLPVTLHHDVEAMLNLSKVLSNKTSSVQELCQALEELEDYVHQINNAKDLNGIGGLVLVVRLLNHTHPDVKKWAARVIGSASQR